MGQRQNTILLNVSAGETSPELYGRIDLPAFQRSYQRVQNYEVLPQGALRYRNGTQHVHNTKSVGVGRLLPFTFSQQDTFILEFTNKFLRFYRDFGSVDNSTTFTITGITKTNPGVITTSAPHGYTNGQEVVLSGIVGMVELNDQSFLVANTAATTFTLTDLFGNAIDTTSFLAWISGGKTATPYEIATPFLAVDLNQVHISQSADTIIMTHQDYMPYKLTRAALTSWAIKFFTRTADPFNQQQVSAATAANPGVFTVPAAHGFKVGETLYFDGWVGNSWPTLNQLPRTYTVNSVPTPTTFTIASNGNPVDTTTFGAITTKGTVISTQQCPQTSAFLDGSRLSYANTRSNPPGIIASKLPDPLTGTTKFDDFTPGANDNDAYYFTLAPVFNQQDAIQWITTNNAVVVLGCASSIRQLTGSNGPTSGITPSSIAAKAISNTGAAPIQPYSNGLTVFYVDQTTFRVASFVFSIQVYNYVTVNQNLIANQLSTSPFIALSQQRREASLLWILRQDGVLAGMTFNEIESVYGWHRHYIGGNSAPSGVKLLRANVLSACVEQRQSDDAILWLIVERKFSNGNIYRSVEYWNKFQKFYDPYDYYSGANSYAAQTADVQAFRNATSEQLKNSIHLDCNITFNGAARGITANASLTYGTAPAPPPVVVTPGITPEELVITPDGAKLYVMNFDSDSVSVYDTASNALVLNITVGDGPRGIAINKAGTKVYVANAFDHTVSVIDTATDTVIGLPIAVGNQPNNLTVKPDDSEIWVTNSNGNDVSVVDAVTLAVTHTIACGNNPTCVRFTADGTKVYVSNFLGNSITHMDPVAYNVVGTIALTTYTEPDWLTTTADSAKMYVTCYSGGVEVIETATDSIINHFPIVPGNPVTTEFTPDGKTGYIASMGATALQVLNLADDTLGAPKLVLVNCHGMAIKPDQSALYLGNTASVLSEVGLP